MRSGSEAEVLRSEIERDGPSPDYADVPPDVALEELILDAKLCVKDLE